MEPSSQLLVCAPLAVEAMALGKSAHVRVVRTGMGPKRSKKSAAKLAHEPARAVVVAGFGGALDPSLEPGDVVVANEVRCEDSCATCASEKLAEILRTEGLRVKIGTIASRDRIVRGDERRVLFEEGACAVDMESAWLAAAAAGRPFFVVRAVVDGPHHEFTDVLGTLRGGTRGLKSLARVGRALERFASTL
jgi:4-hydroxy-3-methylbut-2-enyl diphosphate reductase